jgi:hypothetical protein
MGELAGAAAPLPVAAVAAPTHRPADPFPVHRGAVGDHVEAVRGEVELGLDDAGHLLDGGDHVVGAADAVEPVDDHRNALLNGTTSLSDSRGTSACSSRPSGPGTRSRAADEPTGDDKGGEIVARATAGTVERPPAP